MSDPPDESPPEEAPLVYVSDASAEGQSLLEALGARGFRAEQVALEGLVQRVSRERPQIILCDLDAPGAIEVIGQLREVPQGGRIDVVFLASEAPSSDEVAHESSGTLVRPVDPLALLRKVEALIGTPVSSHPPHQSRTTKPPATKHSAPPRGPSAPPTFSSLPPRDADGAEPLKSSAPPGSRPSYDPDDESSHPSLPAPVPLGLAPETGPAQRAIPQSLMSPELESLLARAEQRVGAVFSPPSDRPSAPPRMTPEAEVEAVLPAEVLAALDEPLDIDAADDDSDVGSGFGTRSGTGGTSGTGHGSASGAGASGGTGLGTGIHTGPGSAPGGAGGTSAGGTVAGPTSLGRPETGIGQPPSAATAPGRAGPSQPPSAEEAPRPPSWPAPPPNAMVTAVEARPSRPSEIAIPLPQFVGSEPAPARAAPPGTPGQVRIASVSTAPPAHAGMTPTVAPGAAPSAPPGPAQRATPATPDIPAVLRPGDALRAVARAVRSRFTGALAFEDPAGIRRVVMRDGDFVTSASGVEGETLVGYLVERGMIEKEVGTRLGHRLPAFGRHAGAALIANGHLRQDELWSVLRAHSEWILGRVLGMASGGASIEREVPPRLQAEPAVYGGATGAEVLVEIGRRVIPPALALTDLGGRDARLAEGPSANLLGECALPDAELALVNRAKSASVGELVDASSDQGTAALLCVLLALGVLEGAAHVSAPAPAPAAAPQWDAVDDEAVRARIVARRALVEEGDYFALLGVPRGATGYDVRRAYLELRREFEPNRVLTAATADLSDDVTLIVEVLDEAYDILRDNIRRDRYRRALDATPR